MHYKISYYSAIVGDRISLMSVAESMARHAATGYGKSKFGVHGPTLKNTLRTSIELLLDAANSGALTICDSRGCPASIAKIVNNSFLRVVQEGFSISEQTILALYSRAKHLSDWGATNGDEFEFVDRPAQELEFDLEDADGKVVEKGFYRGRYIGTEQKEPLQYTATPILASSTKLTASQPKADVSAPPLENWMMQVQAEAAKRWIRYRKQSANPTKNTLKDELAKWCKTENIRTKSNINPSAEYLYRHVLRRWTPPIDG